MKYIVTPHISGRPRLQGPSNQLYQTIDQIGDHHNQLHWYEYQLLPANGRNLIVRIAGVRKVLSVRILLMTC